jgi:WD40 repeat protein
LHTKNIDSLVIQGIISTLAFSPDYSGLFAAGSYSKNIGLYDASTGKICSAFGGLDGGVTQVCHRLLTVICAGERYVANMHKIWQVKFSPTGTYLFSANRQDNKIICWDIRNTGEALCHFERPGYTNQRIAFDIDSAGQVLASGDTVRCLC